MMTTCRFVNGFVVHRGCCCCGCYVGVREEQCGKDDGAGCHAQRRVGGHGARHRWLRGVAVAVP